MRSSIRMKSMDYLEKAIEERVFPGCVVGYTTGEGEKDIIALGKYTYEKDAPRMEEDSIFDVASVTKSIPTSCLALKLIEQGALKRSDTLIQYVPEYAGVYREQITIDHLLTQTLSFDFRLSSCRDMPPDRILETIFKAPLGVAPGTAFNYANATSILLGLVIEKVTRRSLAIAAQEFFFGPLGMGDTSFFPQQLISDRIVPTEIDSWRNRIIKGEVHDESAWALRPMVIAGSAGLFSTAPDLLQFLEMLVNGGTAGDKKFFEPEMIQSMHSKQTIDSDTWYGLGWELNQRSYMGIYASISTFGKTGFTGCVVMVDPEKKVGLVFLSNYTYPYRKKNRDAINKVRSALADMVFCG